MFWKRIRKNRTKAQKVQRTSRTHLEMTHGTGLSRLGQAKLWDAAVEILIWL